MLSQLIVVDFTKSQNQLDLDAYTEAYERTTSFSAVEERPEFTLYLYNYDKHYTNRADSRIVFIHTHEHALGEAVTPWVSVIDLAYRRLLTAVLERVKHNGVITLCNYKCEAEQPSYVKHLNWIEKSISV